MENIFYGKNRRTFICIYLVLLIAWLTFIFYNSIANGIKSSQQSSKVAEFLQMIIRNFDPEAMVDVAFVRTTAHFIEFFVLGALYYVGSFFIKTSRVSLFIHSLSLSLFTAFADETIQMFSSGRGSEVKDVWTDFLGAVAAHIIIFAIYYSYKHFKTASR